MSSKYDSRRPRNLPFFLLVDDKNDSQDNPRRAEKLFVNLDYHDWSDKTFLTYLRDKLIFVHGYKESSDIIYRLNEMIFREKDDDIVSGV